MENDKSIKIEKFEDLEVWQKGEISFSVLLFPFSNIPVRIGAYA